MPYIVDDRTAAAQIRWFRSQAAKLREQAATLNSQARQMDASAETIVKRVARGV